MKPGEVHVGCSGWFYWHRRNLFYPADIPTHHWFRHYLSVFDTVELNAPFYRWPQPSTVKGWVRQAKTNGDFLYTVKVNQLITHEKRFRGTKKMVHQFYQIADVLGPRMGCFLFQLPPSYHFSRSRLESLLRQLDPRLKNAVEFRHKSWWRTSVTRAFEKAGLIFCSVSGPRLPDDLIQTHPSVYLRFHGTKKWYRHDYLEDELAIWVEKIRKAKPGETWAYFNNDREGFAIKNGLALRKMLSGE